MKNLRMLAVLSVCYIITAVFFYQTVLYGKLPVPSDTLVGLYHPWRDLYEASYPRGIPYKNYLITDPIRQQIPWRKVVMDSWKQGVRPTLNAYSFGGVPLDANIQAAAFYPLNILFLLFSFPAAWTVLIILQPFLAGLLLYMYLRHLRLHPISAAIGAIAWAYGGFATAWLTWGTILHTVLWLPLMLMSIDNLYVTGKQRMHYIRWTIVLAAAAIMTVLAGHIQVALYSGTLAFIYVMWKWTQTREKIKLSWIWLAGLVALLVSAVQWMPLISFFAQSGRVGDASAWLKAGWFMPWEHLIQFFAPDFFGNPATLNYWGQWNYGEFVGYVGIIPLALAMSAAFLGSVPGFFTVVMLTSIAFMLPGLIGKLPFLLHIPVLSVMQPTRLMVLVDFSLAILAAYGLENLITGGTKRLWRSVTVVGAVLLVLWAVVLGSKLSGADSQMLANLATAKRNLFVPSAVFGILLVWLFIFRRLKEKTRKYIGMIVLCVVVTADLFRFGWKFTPFTPLAYFFPETGVIRFLKSQEKPFRIMSLDDRIMPPNVSAYYGIESIEGYDPVAPLAYDVFLAASERGFADDARASGFNRIYTAHNIDSPVLSYLNVRYVLALSEVKRPFLKEVMREGQTRVYAYTRALPRVYLADSIEVLPQKETLASLFGYHVSYRAIYDGSADVMNTPLMGDETAQIISYAPNSMTVRVSANNKRLLVILNRYDPRWKATESGLSVPLHRVNYLFMGMAVSAGTHDIILSYR